MSQPKLIARRNFLGQTLLGFAGYATIRPDLLFKKGDPSKSILGFSAFNSTGNSIKVFAAESGNYGKEKLYALGLLIVDGDETIHENQLIHLRETNQYRTKLTYNGNDKFKYQFTQGVIDYFSSTSSLTFVAGVANNQNVDLSPQQIASRKTSLYQSLLSQAGLNAGSVPTIFVKSQTPYGPSQFYINEFSQLSGGIALQALNTVNSNLLQTAGLLTGCIRQDIEGIVQSSSVKARLAIYLKGKLTVTSFMPPVTSGTKFRVFTV